MRQGGRDQRTCALQPSNPFVSIWRGPGSTRTPRVGRSICCGPTAGTWSGRGDDLRRPRYWCGGLRQRDRGRGSPFLQLSVLKRNPLAAIWIRRNCIYLCKEAGITLSLTSEPPDQLLASTEVCAGTSSISSKCTWQISFFGAPRFLYEPDFYPTGEDINRHGRGCSGDGYSNGRSTP